MRLLINQFNSLLVFCAYNSFVCVCSVSVPAAIALLTGMSEILGTEGTSDIKPSSQLLTELSQFIYVSAPFGTPNDANPTNVKLQQQFKKSSTVPKEKVCTNFITNRIILFYFFYN